MVVNEGEQYMQHCRLGHTSGPVLKTLFPSIFKNDDSLKFNCEVWVLSKHHRNADPRRNRMSDSMFLLFVLMYGVLHLSIHWLSLLCYLYR